MWTASHSDSRRHFSIPGTYLEYGETLPSMRNLWPHSVPLRAAGKFGHLDGAAHDERRALMDAFGLDVEDPPGAIARAATGLFGQKTDGIDFVEKAQLALRMIACRRI